MNSAIILAAGEGRGAWPFCGIRQKVTVPVANVPMVRRLALDLLALGVKDIVAVIGHRGEAVRACLGDLDVVRFVEQHPLNGPVHAALCGLDGVSADEVLVCAGDIVTTRETLESVLVEFRTRNAEALLLVAPCPEGVPHWTSVQVEADGLVSGVRGHGSKDQPRFAGIAVAKTELLKRFLLRNPGIMENVHVGAMPPVEGDLAYTFDLMRRDGIEVHVVHARDFLVDVDRPWHIAEANRCAAQHAIEQLERTVVAEGAFIQDGADVPDDAKLVLGPGAQIGKGCRIGGSLILGAQARILNGAIVERGVILGDQVTCRDYGQVGAGSVLGARSIVGHCAEFLGVTFDVVYLYHYSCVAAVIGSHVDIGAATVCGTWRFDDNVRPQVVKGHKEIPDAHGDMTFIGDYARTGVNAMFMPGVKVGYYSCVGPGAIVCDDVPERTLLLAKQEQVSKPWGPEKYGW